MERRRCACGNVAWFYPYCFDCRDAILRRLSVHKSRHDDDCRLWSDDDAMELNGVRVSLVPPIRWYGRLPEDL